MSVFFFFAVATVVGTLSTLFWIPEDDLGRGYFQMNALVVLGLLALAWSVLLLHPLQPFGTGVGTAGWNAFALGTLGSCLYYGAMWKERWRWARAAAALALGGCTFGLLAATVANWCRSRLPSPSANCSRGWAWFRLRCCWGGH